MKELTTEAVVQSIAQVTQFVDEELERVGCSPRAQMQLDVAIDEILGNIARYAYAPGTGRVTVRADVAPGRATLTFIDSGAPFNPLEAKEPDVSLPAQERQIGGLGIFLVRKTMDDMHYARQNGQNILTLTKTL